MTPFEELEYLSDHLPDEGEAIVVHRRRGTLVCEPYQDVRTTVPPAAAASLPGSVQVVLAAGAQSLVASAAQSAARESLSPGCLGRLVHCAERLKFFAQTTRIAVCAATGVLLALPMVWPAAAGHWSLAIVLAGTIAMALHAWRNWILQRAFRRRICPVLEAVLEQSGYDKFELIAALRSYPELQPITRALCLWV